MYTFGWEPFCSLDSAQSSSGGNPHLGNEEERNFEIKSKCSQSRFLTPPVYLKLLSGNLLVAGLGQDQSVVTVLSWEHSHVLHRQYLAVAWCLVRMYRGFQGSFGLFLVADN